MPSHSRLRRAAVFALAISTAAPALAVVDLASAAAAAPVLVRPQVKLAAPDGAHDDGFGMAIAVSDDTLVVGARNHNAGEGAVYVYTKPAGGWSHLNLPVAQLTPDGSGGEHFGTSVAVSGNTIVVGAPDENGSRGAAYVFTKPTTGWANVGVEDAKLTEPAGVIFDKFGASVGVDGPTVVAGSPGSKVGSVPGSGAAYVFTEPVSGWTGSVATPATLAVAGGLAQDHFGTAITISGSTVVGTSVNDDGTGTGYAFLKPPAGWTGSLDQSATLKGTDTTDFGASVSISGHTVAIGSGPSSTATGDVHLFNQPSTEWTGTHTDSATLGRLAATAGDEYGLAAAASSDRVLAGAPGQDSGAGAAYMYRLPSTGWVNSATPSIELQPNGLAAGDGFGSSVALAAGVVAVGAPNQTEAGNTLAGAVYLFAAPQVSNGSLSAAKFKAAYRAPVLNPATKPAGGTFVNFTLDRSVAVRLTVSKVTSAGHLKPLRTLRGSGRAGANHWYFAGAFNSKTTLAAGHYAARVSATNQIGSSSSAVLKFTIAPSKPSLTKVTQSRERWALGSRTPKLNPKKLPHTGTRFRFSLNVPATVKFVFSRKQNGHFKKAGSLHFKTPRGRDVVSFEGWLSSTKFLHPGAYRVKISATNKVGRSRTKTLRFVEQP